MAKIMESITLPLSEAGVKSATFDKRKCDYCKKEYTYYHSYNVIKSDFDKKVFCSYNCRCKYYKENEEKRYYALSKAEHFKAQRKKQNDYSKKRYAEMKGGKKQSGKRID